MEIRYVIKTADGYYAGNGTVKDPKLAMLFTHRAEAARRTKLRSDWTVEDVLVPSLPPAYSFEKITGLLVVLMLSVFLHGCSMGGGSKQSTSPPPTSDVTSVSIAPSNALTLSVNGTQQFISTVMGTGSFNTSVTWQLTGNGSISTSGLYTAPPEGPGTAFITATSVEDGVVSNQVQITVQAAPVSLLGWYGNLVPSNGTASYPLDFDLTQTGTTVTSGPVLVIDSTLASNACATLNLEQPPQGNGYWLQPVNGVNLYPTLSGTISGIQVSLTFVPFGSQSILSAINMVGTLGTDADGFGIITGTYNAAGQGAVCAGSSGTFTFNQFENYMTTGNTFQGNYTVGVLGTGTPPVQANNAQVTLTFPGGQPTLFFAAVAPPEACPASPVYTMQIEGAGRFYHIFSEPGQGAPTIYGTQAGPDKGGNVLNTYFTNGSSSGSCPQLPTSTFSTLIGGPITLTQQ